jgi:hypothetical protein
VATGIALGYQVLDLGDGERSARLTENLRRLHTAAARHRSEAADTLTLQLDSRQRMA